MLMALMKSTYFSQFWKQSYVLANVDLLGNPVATFTQIAAGVSDLVNDSMNSLNERSGNTGNVFDGIGKGAKSFWDHTVYGAFNVVSKMSGAAAQVRK